MKRKRQTTLGLLSAGVAVGLAAGILLAPKSGKEARANVSERAGGAWNKANGIWRFLSRRGKSEPDLSDATRRTGNGRSGLAGRHSAFYESKTSPYFWGFR